MPAPTDPVLLQERLSSIVRDVEHAESARVRAPLSAHPLPVAALRGRLHNATTWLGRVWSAHARGGPAVRRWLTDEPLASPVPPSNPRLPLRKQFRVALATAFLGASVAAGCYVLTAPLADPFFGLIPPDIFSRLPPFTEKPVDSGPDGQFTPQVGTAPGAPVVARLPVPPAPEPAPPPSAPDAGSRDPVTRSDPQTAEPGGTSPRPPALAPEPPTAPPTGPAPTTTADPPTTVPPTTVPTTDPTTAPPPTTTTTLPPTTTQPPTTTVPTPTTTTEPTGTAPTTTPSTEPTTTNPPTTGTS